MAKKLPKKAAAISMDLKRPWLVLLLAVLYFVVTCMMFHGRNKLITLLLVAAAIVCIVARYQVLACRISLPALFLGLYVLMDGIASLYAPSGRFAIFEVLKVIAAACMSLLLTACEPERGIRTGRCAATVLSLSGALAGFFSIDMVSTRWLSGGLFSFINAFGIPTSLTNGVSDERLVTIFENPNVLAGCLGISVLLSLGLAASAEAKKERCLHLSCLLVSCTAFVLCISRSAMVAIALAFLLYLLLCRGAQRAYSFVLMVETLLLTLLASVFTFATAFGEWTGVRPWPLLMLLVCAAALCLLDLYVGRPFAEKLSLHMKALNITLLGILAAIAALLIVAVNWTGSAALQPGKYLWRSANLPQGEYTLFVEADGPVNVIIQSKTTEDAIMNTKHTVYSGPADGVEFTAPADNRTISFGFSSSEPVHISAVTYSGTSSGALKLNYKLLPEAIAYRLQDLYFAGNMVQRLVYCADGLKIFQSSPVFGAGMGAFENDIYSVQSYHYQTKYVHNHYIQTLLETGIAGAILWLGLLVTSAIAVLRLWRKGKKESPHPMAAALAAMLLYMIIHAAVEFIFSSGHFLPFGFGAFAVINLFCGDLLPIPKLKEAPRLLLVWGSALCLAVFGALLAMNMRASVLAGQGDYTSVSMAADLDPYEWPDYKISYVCSASAEEEISQNMRDTMEQYLADLEKLRSYSVPLYLAECYFNLGDTQKGFAMLEKYAGFAPSYPNGWESSFRMAMGFDDGSAEFRQGVSALARRLERWNEENLGTVTLPDDVQSYIRKS